MVKVWQSVDEYLHLSETDQVMPLRHLLNAWRWAVRDARHPPILAEVMSPGLRGVTPNMALITVDAPAGTATYRLVGHNLVRLLGKDPSGREVHDVYPMPIAREVFAALQTVAQTGRPTFYRRDFMILGRSFGYFRLLLPVSRAEAGAFVLLAIYPSSTQFFDAKQWQSHLDEAERISLLTQTTEPVWV